MNVLIHEHHKSESAVFSELQERMISRLKGSKIVLSDLRAPELKNKVVEIFREAGWSSEVSVDFELKHFISGIFQRVGFMAQFGNMAMCYADLLKLQLLFDRDMIECAFYIVMTKSDIRARKENYAQYEKFCKHLKLYSKIIKVPITVMGIESDEHAIRF